MYSDVSMFLIAMAAGAVFTAIVYGLFRLLNYKFSYPYLIGFCVALVLLTFTFQKINKMNILLGNSAGRELTSKKITRKWRDVYRSKGRAREVPMLCFQDGGEVCVDVGDSVWNDKKEGEIFSVFSAPGDDDYFHTTGVYLTEGNLAFDYFLLVAESLAAVFCLVKILFPGFLALDKFGRSNNIKLFDENGNAEE